MSDQDLFLLQLIVKWSILLGGFACVWLCLPRTSLKPRVWVWRIAWLVWLGVTSISCMQPLAQFPLLTTVEPVSLPVDSSPRTEPASINAATKPKTEAKPTNQAAADLPIPDAPLAIQPLDVSKMATPKRPWWTWSMALPSLWAAVSAALLARLLWLVSRDQRWLRSQALIAEPTHPLFNQLMTAHKLRPGSVTLEWSSEINTPTVIGWYRPHIVLPVALRAADTRTLHSALAHELAHIASHDIAWSLGLRVWQAIAWVCPVVWFVPRLHHDACELLADHRASRSLGDRSDYRQILAALALNCLAKPAKAVPGGAVISMLRTPVILNRLRMLERTDVHSHIGSITRITFWLICLAGILLGGLGVTRTRAQAPQNAASQTLETRPVLRLDATTADDPDAVIRILNPDGSAATNVQLTLAPNRYRGQVLLSADPTSRDATDPLMLQTSRDALEPMSLAGEASVKRSEISHVEFVVLWNEQGFRHAIVSQLVGQKELKLQAWSALNLQVRNGDQPVPNCKIMVQCRSTSDGIHQGATVVQSGVTDEQGRLVLPRVPPGALIIQRNTVRKSIGNVSTTISPRSTTVLARAGEVLELTQGGSGQTIEGKLDLRGHSPWAFRCQLHTDNRRESFDFFLEEDGGFRVEDVPSSECTLEFRRVQPFEFFASHTFRCPGNSAEPAFSVGTIEPKDRQKTRETGSTAEGSIQRHWMPTQQQLTPTDEAVGRIDDAGGHYVLRSADGRILRELPDVSSPPGWSSSSAHYDWDTAHQRLALLVRDQAGNQYLCVMNDRGLPMWTRHLSQMKNYRVAIDYRTGNLWLLCKSTLDDGSVEVLDDQGKLVQTYSIPAFTLDYCPSDHSFWFGGKHDIKKIDANNGRELAAFALPKDIFVIDTLRSLSDGSVLAGEGAHPDMSGSANRLWHVDAQGKLISAVDIGNLYLKTGAPQPLGKDFITPVARISGWLGAYEQQTLLVRISGDLQTVRQIEAARLEEESIDANTPGEAWLRLDNKRYRVSWDSQGKIKTTEY